MTFFQLMSSVIVGLGSGVISSLLTSWITPGQQHRFWMIQRRVELCLAVLTKLNKLLDDYVKILGSGSFSTEFASRKLSLLKEVRPPLFSPAAAEAFEKLNRVLVLPPEPGSGEWSDWHEKFTTARGEALEVLYSDIGMKWDITARRSRCRSFS